jgi:hypothetical protein
MSVPLITLYLMAQALIGLVLIFIIWYLRLRTARWALPGFVNI